MPFPSIPSPPNIFPTYLVPALKFRRKSSTDSNVSTDSARNSDSTDSTERPDLHPTFLSGHTSHLRCARCLADLALSDQIISKGFTGRHGRAFLVAPTTSAIPQKLRNVGRRDTLPNLPNTFTHKAVPRQLVTGAHTVSDISCAHCGSVLGWKYVAAEEEGQMYKVGKFILETKRVCRSSLWEDDSERPPPSSLPAGRSNMVIDEDIEFDSQDEDECEDLFMGIWTPQSAARRRKWKQFNREQ